MNSEEGKNIYIGHPDEELDGNSIIGWDSNVLPHVKRTVVLGNNITADESDAIYINGGKYIIMSKRDDKVTPIIYDISTLIERLEHAEAKIKYLEDVHEQSGDYHAK